MSAGAAAGAAAAAAMEAVRANGVLVRVEPTAFLDLLGRQPGLLVVRAAGGWLKTRYQYLTSYKGLAFHAVSDAPLDLPAGAEVVDAKAIWMPG